jgi:caa(3)-type oxidase subunit IV
MAKHKDGHSHDGHSHDGHAHAHDVVHADHERPNIKLYLGVFAALMVLTGLTVFVSKFHLPRPQAIALGLLIACTKASLVGAVFMHLWGEKKLIHKFLYTAFAFGAIMIIPIIDFVLLAPKIVNHADVAAEHPDEGKSEAAAEAPAAAPAPAATPAPAPAKAKKKGKK